MFADLNRHSVKPSASIGVLYDHRDPLADLTRNVVESFKPLAKVVEREKTTLAPKSKKLFTLSAVHQCHRALTAGVEVPDLLGFVIDFWSSLFMGMPDWRSVAEGHQSSGEVRQEMIHSHGTILHALGRAGNSYFRQNELPDWNLFASTVAQIDWSRNAMSPWNGRVVFAGSVSKSNQSVALAAAYIKRCLNLELSNDEIRFETALTTGGTS